MSAIFGIINKNGSPVGVADIDKIQSVMQHRATDGNGLWTDADVVLGHCKLAVASAQKYEQLPFAANQKIITADGHLHNREELLNLLGADKLQNAATPDSTLILAACEKWGAGCVDRLEGEYVFAVWDKQDRSLFIATDAMGLRPVYYYDDADRFIFCSEIKGIKAVKHTPDRFNEESLVEYFFRQSDSTQTYLKDVYALGGGNILALQNGRIAVKKYWEPGPRGKFRFTKDSDWTDCLRDLLYRAVENRLYSEMPVGVTLSGGLDSTSIACILADLLQKKNKPLYAFSSVLPVDHGGIEIDERKYIELVNKRCPNIIQTYVEAAGVGPFDRLEDAFDTEEGFPNVFFFMDRAIMEAAHAKTIRSLFSGIGGDYWVSWSGNTVVYDLVNRLKWKDAAELIQSFRKTERRGLFDVLMKKYVAYTPVYEYYLKLKKDKSVNWQQETMLKPEFLKPYLAQLKFDKSKDHTRMMIDLIRSGRVAKTKALCVNRNGRYGMESMEPMFDKAMNEFLADVPSKIFVAGGQKRSFLRGAMNGIIPEDIRLRTDKLPYAPGYQQRVLTSEDLIYRLKKNNEYNFIFDRFIAKERMFDHLGEVRPQRGFTPPENIVGIRIMQAVIACEIINLINKNYLNV